MILKIIYFGMFVSLILTVLLEPLIIPYMRKLKYGQTIRKEGPQSHQAKSGTPTMGGIAFLLVPLVTIVFFFNFYNQELMDFNIKTWMLIFLPLIGYSIIGFIDDYLIVVKKNNDGLKAKIKLILQIIIAVIFFCIYIKGGYSTEIKITNTLTFDFKWLYGVLIFFMLVGGTNAVNLTDGLDGLAAGLSAFTIATFTFISYITEQYDIMLFGSTILGCVLGFLVFNSHPAKIFMGDTGSLALGAAIATMAILTKYELLLVVAGGVFVIETLSVILQVTYFKRTKGKRLFKMTPLHHHFELSGLRESTVVLLFYSFGLLFSIISIIIVLMN